MDFADHNPASVEVHHKAYEASSARWLYRHGDVTRLFDDVVASCHVDDRLRPRTVEHFAAVAEVQLGRREDADVAPERVVAVDADGAQRPHRVQPEQNLDRVGVGGPRALRRLPRHPLVAAPTDVLRVQAEVGGALVAVDQLAESAGQLTVDDVTVIGEVEELDLRASAIALTHAV